MAQTFGNIEMLQIADAVAREKNIDREMVLDAMEQAKMLIDVSHCGDRTTLDAIALAKGPIAITHSNARALVDHPRVKTDEAIKALAAATAATTIRRSMSRI